MKFDCKSKGGRTEYGGAGSGTGTGCGSPPQLNDINAPAPLRDLPYWMVWRLEQFEGEARARKVPYWANGTRRHGTQGSPEDRARLTTFAAAREAAIRKGFDGVGFAHVAGGGVITLDFDNCVVDRVVRPDVLALVEGTYAEYSPSGKGIHAVFFGAPDTVANSKVPAHGDDFAIEAFSSKGFTTFTGWTLDHVDLLHGPDHIAPIPSAVVEACRVRFNARGAAPVDPDDFLAGREPRLGLSLVEMEELLSHLNPSMGRDPWIKIGMALHHETEGDDTGFELWDTWSSEGDTYPGSEQLRYQWDRFEQRPGRRSVTMATVKGMVKEAGNGAHKTRSMDGSLPTAQAIEASPYHCQNPANIPPRNWVYGYQLLGGTVACLVAAGGTGKSTLLAGLALSLATGKPLLGKQIWRGPQGAWLWNLEDDLDELARSIEAARKHYGVDELEIGDRLFVNSGMNGSPLMTAVKTSAGVDLILPVYAAVKAEIERLAIKVLIIDPFISSHAVDENANMDIDMVVKAWSRIAKETGCCILLSHHTNKAGSTEVSAMSARGASALTNAARSVLVLSPMSKEEAAALGVPDAERRRYVKLRDDKHNRAPPEKEDWYQLESVCLENGADGWQSDSVGVMTRWTAPEVTTHELTIEQIRQVQDLAGRELYRKDQQAPDWFGYGLAEILDVGAVEQHEKRRLKQLIDRLIHDGFLAVKQKPNGRKATSPYIVVGSVVPTDGAASDAKPATSEGYGSGGVAKVADV